MIHLQDVKKSFKGTPSVKELNLTINEGEIFGLLGANGAGKSTTINMFLGLLQPDSGKVQIDNIDTVLNAHATRKLIGYIPENVNLYPYLTGLENLDYFCSLSGLTYSKCELKEYLSTCGLQADSHSKKVAGYSKGSVDDRLKVMVLDLWNDVTVNKDKYLEYYNRFNK